MIQYMWKPYVVSFLAIRSYLQRKYKTKLPALNAKHIQVVFLKCGFYKQMKCVYLAPKLGQVLQL